MDDGFTWLVEVMASDSNAHPQKVGYSPRKASKCGDRVCCGFAAADGAFHVAVPPRGVLLWPDDVVEEILDGGDDLAQHGG